MVTSAQSWGGFNGRSPALTVSPQYTLAAASKAKIKAGGEDAKAEIEKLQKAYEELDQRSKLILRLVWVLSGLDLFLSL
mgnify:CR=1